MLGVLVMDGWTVGRAQRKNAKERWEEVRKPLNAKGFRRALVGTAVAYEQADTVDRAVVLSWSGERRDCVLRRLVASPRARITVSPLWQGRGLHDGQDAGLDEVGDTRPCIYGRRKIG